MTLRGYFEHVDRHPETQLLCVEQPTPVELCEMFKPPGYCRAGPVEDGWESRLFVGNKGNLSNLHFDADFRAVLLHQVFGTKQLVLVPPSQSPKMLPFLNLSRLELARFTDRDRDEFLAYVHGYQTVLLPGETAYIPTAYWHHVDYLENSLSINIRLPRNEFLRLIGGRGIHKVWRLGCVAASAADPTTLTSADHDDMRRLRDVLHGPATPEKRLALMEALIGELYERRCPDLPRDEYTRLDEAISERSVWQLLLDQGVLYAD
jgi:Cupin-like domain